MLISQMENQYILFDSVKVTLSYYPFLTGEICLHISNIPGIGNSYGISFYQYLIFENVCRVELTVHVHKRNPSNSVTTGEENSFQSGLNSNITLQGWAPHSFPFGMFRSFPFL